MAEAERGEMEVHHHEHAKGHSHAPKDFNHAFAIGITLNLIFVAVEVVYGLASNSLALIADGGHNFVDVLSLLLAWGATMLATRRPTSRHTYGFKRATILVSLVSALLLYAAIGAIIWEAIGRFRSPVPPDSTTIIVVAAIGVVINTATALLFLSGREKDLNIKGAFLHMAADALVSVGVVGAGFAIAATGWLWLDPATSLVIAVLILLAGWGLLRDSLHLSMDGVPAHIDSQKVLAYLTGISGVTCVHDLHIWAASTTENVLSAHLVMPEGGDDDFLHTVSDHLHHQFDINHSTIQIERNINTEICRLDGSRRGGCWIPSGDEKED